MSSSDMVLVISAVTVSITTIIGAIFAGWIALKQLPQVHTLVNRNFTEQKTEIAELRMKLEASGETALAKAEAREAS